MIRHLIPSVIKPLFCFCSSSPIMLQIRDILCWQSCHFLYCFQSKYISCNRRVFIRLAFLKIRISCQSKFKAYIEVFLMFKLQASHYGCAQMRYIDLSYHVNSDMHAGVSPPHQESLSLMSCFQYMDSVPTMALTNRLLTYNIDTDNNRV